MEDYETAFGVAIPAFEDAYEVGTKVPADELIDAELSDTTRDILEELMILPAYLSGHVLSGVREAERAIVLAFVNDFPNVIDGVLTGDGRGAALRARLIFEHLVNLCTVLKAEDLAQQYLDHGLISRRRIAKRAGGLPHLKGKQRKQEERKVRQVLENSKRRCDQLVSKYGNWFQTRWDKTPIKDRAKEFGLSDLYEGYGILSGVVHGDVGSLAGVFNVRGTETTMRIGGDLRLADLAYVEGLECAREFLSRMRTQAEVGHWAFEKMLECVEYALAAHGEVKTALRKADAKIWPKEFMPGPIAICALFRNGNRWYFHEPKMGTVLPAEPPVLDDFQEQTLTKLRDEHLLDYDWEWFRGRPMSVAFAGITLTPTPNARPVPATAILIPPELKIGRERTP